MRKVALAACALLLCACSKKENQVPSPTNMDGVRANLAFTCVREADHLPSIDPDSDQLFAYGRYLEQQAGPKNFDEAARYYRIAAAYGHFKANHNLQLLISAGLAASPAPEKETIDLVELLIKANIPGGFYDMGHYLELGYGVKQDADKARRYFRKAADLGSPEAQAYVGDLLAPRNNAPEVARQMRQCAADQGYGDAASTLGVDLSEAGRYAEAVEAFQRGVSAGDRMSASFLEDGFKGPPSTDRLNYLALPNDPERSRRYRLIGQFLDANDGRNPQVPDIDKIVPLPPAKLPRWDETFEWQKRQDSATPPEKPSEELVDRLAKAKHLNAATGLPLPGAASMTSEATPPSSKDQAIEIAARFPLGTVAYSGDACPEDGVWCANLGARQAIDGAQRRFTKGQTLPPLTIQAPRQSGLLGRWKEKRGFSERVVWQLMAYRDEA